MTEEKTTRTIEFESGREKFRIDIRPDDRVTYGQVAPGSKMSGGYALRIYAGASKEITRAVFSNVSTFREIDMPLQRLAVRKFGSEEWHIDDGSYSGKKAETVERKWVNADEVKDGPVDEPEEVTRAW